jgi:outer membrane protein OmpA-like peptidoglycan-associated protein
VQSAASPALEQARAAEKAREREAARALQAERGLAAATAAVQAADRARAAIKADLETAQSARAAAEAEVLAEQRARAEALARAQAAEQEVKAAEAKTAEEHDALDRSLWQLASQQNQPAVFQNYLALFPAGIFAEQARAAIAASATQESVVDTVLEFEPGEVTLAPSQKAALASVIDMLHRKPDLRLAIEGHSDNSGRPAINQAIALKRAQSVAARLVAAGVDPVRLNVAGFGADRPTASNASAAGRARNRRVELRVEPVR